MPNFLATVAAATAVVGYDIFTGQVWARSPEDRVLTGIGIKGSAAALDTEVEVFIDEVRVGNFYTSGAGVPNNDDLLDIEDLGVPAGAQLRCIVRDAPATNPINVMCSLEELD
jgi:hypothetical protein